MAKPHLGSQVLKQTICGTPMFMAPELLKHEAYNGSQADVWSLGTVTYFLVTGNYPFEATSLAELKSKVMKHQKFVWDNISLTQ